MRKVTRVRKRKKKENATDESKDSTANKLSRVSVVPSLLCGTLALTDDFWFSSL